MNKEELFNQTWDKMVDIMPYDISEKTKPYIKELAHIVSEQYAELKVSELKAENEKLKKMISTICSWSDQYFEGDFLKEDKHIEELFNHAKTLLNK